MTKLKKIRLQQKLTQDQVAKMLGITTRWYQYLESGADEPGYKLANKLEDLFKIPARELLRKESA